MTTKNKQLPLVYVEWLDSLSLTRSGWKRYEDMQDFAESPFLIRDVGFLFTKTKDYITLVGGETKEEGGWVITYHRELKIPT